MDGRRGRLAAALTAVFICALGATGTARAATITAQPPAFGKPGAGPLTWTFAPATPGAPVAWRLSTETAWHRCTTDGTATFASLPEGRYTLLVADDADDCVPGDTAAPVRRGVPSSAVVVDGTPPVMPAPTVTSLSGPTMRITAPATDALSGVASYLWSAGDGSAPQVNLGPGGQFAHLYAAGHHTGAVTVTDRAGNATTQTFTVDVAPQVPVVAPDVTAPTIGILRVGPRVLASHALSVAVGVSERVTVTLTASVRAGGRTYRLPVTRRTITSNRFLAVRIPVGSAVRHAITRARRARRPVRASVTIVAVDAGGNRRVVSAAGALSG
jgi:hypothetical protein